MFGVWSVVSGGVTGHREAWLKDINGAIRHFDTKEEAEAVAVHYNEKMNHQYSKASFSYSAKAFNDIR